ncbi:MAG: DUF4382 domain-containing protein [Leptospirales bacterium]
MINGKQQFSRNLAVSIILVFLSAITFGCSVSGNSTNGELKYPVFGKDSTKGVVTLLLTDFPLNNANVTSAYVNFRSIEVNSSEDGWITVVDYGDEGRKFDLLKLQNGKTDELGSFSLEQGQYNQIRLILNDDNYLEIDQNGATTRESLKVPSGLNTGIKLVRNFEVTALGYTTFTIDFDAQKSITHNKGQGYILKPTIKILSIETTDGLSVTIDSTTGGTASITGEINVDIPPDALDANTIIEILPISAPLPASFSNVHILSNKYELMPDGTQFNTDVTMTINYDPAEVAANNLDENSLEIYYFDKETDDWVSVGGQVNTSAKSVTAKVNHFTPFGVGGPPTAFPKINPASVIPTTDPVFAVLTQVPESINATISDGDGVASVFIYYNRVGATTSGSCSPLIAANNKYICLIPAAYVSDDILPQTFEVYILAEDIIVPPNKSAAPTGAPGVPKTFIYVPDFDADLMNDRWEALNGLDPGNIADGTANADGDSLLNVDEFNAKSDPNVWNALINVTITGLAAGETLTMENNVVDTQVVNGVGTGATPIAVAFASLIIDAGNYNVTLSAQPPGKTCTITGGAGVVATADVNATIDCVLNTYTVGGTLNGLTGGTVTLQNSAGDDLISGVNGPFVFSIPLADLAGYTVTVSLQPSAPAQNCTITNGAGAISGVSVSNVIVNCTAVFAGVGGLDWRVVSKYGYYSAIEVQGPVDLIFDRYGDILQSVGNQWYVMNTDLVEPVNDIVWGNAEYVTVGPKGVIYTSPDAATWTKQTSGTVVDLDCVIWNGTQYLALGNSTILTSVDGVNWNDHSFPQFYTFNDVVWDGSKYVAVGGNGRTATSNDGITWTEVTVGASTPFLKVIWNGSIFVTVGREGVIANSADGINWNIAMNDTVRQNRDVAWDGAKFVVPSYNMSIKQVEILTSIDGITWVVANTINTTDSIKLISWTGTKFIAITYLGNVYTSIDGINWNVQLPFLKGSFIQAAWDGSNYLVSARENKSVYTPPSQFDYYRTATVLSSNDTINWNTVAYKEILETYPMGSTHRTPLYYITFTGTQYLLSDLTLIDSFYYHSTGGVIETSNDLVTWNSTGLGVTSEITFVNGKYFFFLTQYETYSCGWVGTCSGTFTYIYSSSDSITWNHVRIYGGYGSVASNGTDFVIAGPSNTVLKSTDAINWIAQSTGMPYNVYQNYSDIIWGNNEYIAVGSNGTMITSPDGLTWSLVNTGFTTHYSSIAWNGTRYIAVGGNYPVTNPEPTIVTSTDGVNWQNVINSKYSILRDVIWTGTEFVAVGEAGTILVSP